MGALVTCAALVAFPALSARSVPPAVAAPRAPAGCRAPLAERLYRAALAAPEAAREDGTLYGMKRWTPSTARTFMGRTYPGVLSCAYTVSAIFAAACHPIGRVASVKGIDAALGRWRKVTDAGALEPGDIVFWKPAGGSYLGFECPARWHVGVSLGGDDVIDNDWSTGMPRRSAIDRPCKAFAYARRPSR
jgi:hypothetical protein